MTRTERLEFIAKLRLAKEIALTMGALTGTIAAGATEAGLTWDDTATFALGDGRYENLSGRWLHENGITAKNISAVFDNSIAAQESLL